MKKNKKKIKKRPFRLLKMYSVLIFLFVFLLNVGYAQISNTFNVDGIATALAYEKVFITDAIKITNDTSDSRINNYVQTFLDSKVELINANSQVTYQITIYNNTSKDKLFIDVITDEEEELFYSNPNIEFSLNGLEEYSTILRAKSEIIFTITFKYKTGASTSNNILDSKLNFRFKDIPILALSNDGESYKLSNAYPNFTPQEYDFIVSNYETSQINNTPIKYNFEITIDKPLSAKIYDENGNEVSGLTDIEGNGIIKVNHKYTLKIIWDNSNPEQNIEYDSDEYSGKDFNCVITLKGIPDDDKYLDYNIIKSFNVDIKASDFELQPIDPSEIPTSGSTFTRAYGTIDIQFLIGKGYEIGTANAPVIDQENMVPVNWNGSYWVVTDEEDWDYSYTQSNKKWANVMLRDNLVLQNMSNSIVKTASISEMKGQRVTTPGSMFVWIPRYAYKINYYSSSSKTGNPVGYSDARGFTDSSGRTPRGMSTPVTSISVGNYYRPHPAFENGSKTGFTQGEWDSKLSGIWIAKFETTKKSNNIITVNPNSATYISQTIGNFYTEAQSLKVSNSHMIKNSEWGAMAYLAESIYGRNHSTITRNDAMVSRAITTGEGNYTSNTNQSTTGNVYGIYDTVGGAYEYTAGYVADSSRNYGNSFASTNNSTNNKTESTKFSTVYNSTQNDSNTENYNANINKKFGDGIVETSTSGNATTSWHTAYSYFVGNYSGTKYPFISRGGYYRDTNAGIFSFSDYTGNSDTIYGFRVCAIVE